MTQRYTKKIVCLANSRKPPSGRCVAGREVAAKGFGDWIRPVSVRPTQEISLEERRYENGQDPSLLDIIAVQMKSPQPQRHQRENHLIDADYYWVKQGVISWQELQTAVEDPAGPLWLNGDSSYYGENDRVSENSLDGLARSLYLVRPEHLRLVVASEGGSFGPPRRRVRARFALCGHSYCLGVTEPSTESELLARDNGEYPVPDALLCISLGEVFHGHAYKLAASVITPNRAGT
jgi:hypothetical protein